MNLDLDLASQKLGISEEIIISIVAFAKVYIDSCFAHFVIPLDSVSKASWVYPNLTGRILKVVGFKHQPIFSERFSAPYEQTVGYQSCIGLGAFCP